MVTMRWSLFHNMELVYNARTNIYDMRTLLMLQFSLLVVAMPKKKEEMCFGFPKHSTFALIKNGDQTILNEERRAVNQFRPM